MNKKSIFLTLLLIGGLAAPQKTKPHASPGLIAAMLFVLIGPTVTSIVYGTKGYVERHYRAKNCVQSQKDISFYTVTLTVQKQENRNKKFTTIITKHSFNNTNYAELIAEVKGYTENLIEHQLKHESKKTVLRFALSTQVTLKTDRTITLRNKYFSQRIQNINQNLIIKITQALKSKFAIPSSNWRYKKKTAILWLTTNAPLFIAMTCSFFS